MTTSKKRFHFPLAGLGLVMTLNGCGASGEDEGALRSTSAALTHADDTTHLYLRCNATGWDLTDETRLEPSFDGRIASLTFEVTEDWMVTDGDGCVITETDLLDGWTSTTTAWTTVGSQGLEPPQTAGLSESWTHFQVQYPSKGTYRAVVDRTSGTLTIAPPGTWRHPFSGDYPTEWVPGGYVDHDPSAGLLDYAGGMRVLNGHNGTDYGVGSFRAMDNGLEIVSATAGTVIFTEDRFFDRVTNAESNCASVSNDVIVRTSDGTVITYGHLKRDSVLVEVGQIVDAGDPLGVVGSSGCSSGPHLHFEARDASGSLIDPFELGLWAEPLPYAAPLGVMDVIIVSGGFQEDDSRVQDPGSNATTFAPGELIGVAAYVAGGNASEDFTMRLVDPGGNIHSSATIDFEKPEGQTTWVFNWFLGNQLGTWRAEFVTNGEVAVVYPFQVVD